MAEISITQTELKAFARYCPTGKLIRTIQQHKHKPGKQIGYLSNTGYYATSHKGKQYLVHRLIWLYHYGYLPIEIDHINRIRTDNRIQNLREVSRTENMRNKVNNTPLTLNGKTATIAEWSDITGIKFITIWRRINAYGWPIERALTEPVRK